MNTSSAIEIRQAKESDFEALIALFKEFAVFEKLPEKMMNSVERMRVEKSYFNAYVAVDSENHIVAYASYFFAYYTWTGKCLYMDDLYVKPDYRRMGIGTLLIHKVIGFAKENACFKLRWQVSNWNNDAIQFYRELGAEIDEVERNCDLTM